MTKNELIVKRERLLEELNDINQELYHMENLEKPYVAAITTRSGDGEVKCKTEAQARKNSKNIAGKHTTVTDSAKGPISINTTTTAHKPCSITIRWLGKIFIRMGSIRV